MRCSATAPVPKKSIDIKLPKVSDDDVSGFLTAYQAHVAERASLGIPPLPVTSKQAVMLVELLERPPVCDTRLLLELLTERVSPGIHDAAYVKARFLRGVMLGTTSSPVVSRELAVELLGTLQGGYNMQPLMEALDLSPALAGRAVKGLAGTLLMFDAFYDVVDKMKQGNKYARQVVESWSSAEWFMSRPRPARRVALTVFRVPGETSTEDLSPAPDERSRSDIPLHALAMLRGAGGATAAARQIAELRKKGFPVAYVGDVVGTGPSRKSATNSLLWHIGEDIPCVPNRRCGGYVLGGVIEPVFFNMMEDAGALPIEMDVRGMAMGDVIDLYVYEGVVKKHDSDEVVTRFRVRSEMLLDEVRAGGRIPLTIGRSLTARAREALSLPPSECFITPARSDTVLAEYAWSIECLRFGSLSSMVRCLVSVFRKLLAQM